MYYLYRIYNIIFNENGFVNAQKEIIDSFTREPNLDLEKYFTSEYFKDKPQDYYILIFKDNNQISAQFCIFPKEIVDNEEKVIFLPVQPDIWEAFIFSLEND